MSDKTEGRPYVLGSLVQAEAKLSNELIEHVAGELLAKACGERELSFLQPLVAEDSGRCWTVTGEVVASDGKRLRSRIVISKADATVEELTLHGDLPEVC